MVGMEMKSVEHGCYAGLRSVDI